MAGRSDIETALLRIAPGIPPHEKAAAADHAQDSPGLKRAAPETAAWLSLVTYIRHVYTDYDALLAEGYDRDSARFFVAPSINAVLEAWHSRRFVEVAE